MELKFKRLENQVIVITGASSGIGLATAQKAAAAGARLVLVARSEQTLEMIEARLEEAGADVTVVIADVAEREALQNAADVAVARYGRIDTWIKRNYMPFEPKLPTPQIDPDDVADAILKAATTCGRDIHVGAMSTMNTAIAKILPSLGDLLSAKPLDRQQRRESPIDPAGTLFTAGEGGHVRGLGA